MWLGRRRDAKATLTALLWLCADAQGGRTSRHRSRALHGKVPVGDPQSNGSTPEMPPTCHAKAHASYAGDGASVWGLGFHLRSAADCCRACIAHAAACGAATATRSTRWWPDRPEMKCGRNPPCNIWTFCPLQQCFALDVHRHMFGECWLKFQRQRPTHPKDNFDGVPTYPQSLVDAPRNQWPWRVAPSIWPGSVPRYVPWTSGVIAPADATIISQPTNGWRRTWCAKHPC